MNGELEKISKALDVIRAGLYAKDRDCRCHEINEPEDDPSCPYCDALLAAREAWQELSEMLRAVNLEPVAWNVWETGPEDSLLLGTFGSEVERERFMRSYASDACLFVQPLAALCGKPEMTLGWGGSPMSDARITIDVRRSDGDVMRLQGTAGLAVSTTIADTESRFTRATDTPIISLRASTKFQLTVMLGALITSVEAVAPGITLRAIETSKRMDARNPELRRTLPEMPNG